MEEKIAEFLKALSNKKISERVVKMIIYFRDKVKNSEPNQVLNREFYEINGLKTFVKFKANAFEIGKVLCAFVEFDPDSKKSLKSIDFYMDINKMLLFSADVLSGKLPKLADSVKNKNPKFPPAVFQQQGGTVKDENITAKTFKFGASSRNGFVFSAEQGKGKQDEKGLIQLIGTPETRIFVQCSADDLKSMCLAFQTEYNAYLSSKYTKGSYNIPLKNK